MFVFSNILYSQNEKDSLEIAVIHETLPFYLNTNPNSVASFLKGNDTYNVMYNALRSHPDPKHVKKINAYADSIKNIITSKKIQVLTIDTLYQYSYQPMAYEDLRKKGDWKKKQESLRDEFKRNRFVRLDRPISIEFVDLIKKQIDSKQLKRVINLTDLNKGHYEFIDKSSGCQDSLFCMEGIRVFRPTFNEKKDKACYLISFECKSERVCRDFLFIEKINEKWYYVDSYPSSQISQEIMALNKK
ncbi:hypothetical protein CW731_01595 [Polaribacter sp. ALD11]|nr:hypothetical protein CW731_01595 [Polaribacter sp. ALD11]